MMPFIFLATIPLLIVVCIVEDIRIRLRRRSYDKSLDCNDKSASMS